MGEHRSDILTLPGGLVMARVANERREWVEYRGSVPLTRGGDQAAQLATALKLAVDAVLAGEVELLAPMIEHVNRRAA